MRILVIEPTLPGTTVLQPVSRRLDILITGGRIVDPATGTIAVRDVGIQAGLIEVVSPEPLAVASEQVIDASGYDVLPGVVDLHTHLSSEFAGRVAQAMLVRAGVTTALDLAGPVEDVMRLTRAHGVGITVGCLQRLKPGESISSSDPTRPELKNAITAAKARGALGVKILGGHFPLTPEATSVTVQEAHDQKAWIAFHCGTTESPGDFRGLSEGLALVAGLPAHIAHINAYCRGTTARPFEEAQAAIKSLENSETLFTESYLSRINGTWGTCIDDEPESLATRRVLQAGGYPATRDGLETALLDGYALAHHVRDGRVELANGHQAVEHWRRNGTRVGLSFRVNDALAAVMLAGSRRADGADSILALASDGGGIPRNDTLRLGYLLVRMGVMDLNDLARKASLTPARYLGLPNKGRLSPGADADVAIVRPEDGQVVATVAAGRFVFREGSVVGAGARWLALDVGVREARRIGLDVEVVDPIGQGLYGTNRNIASASSSEISTSFG